MGCLPCFPSPDDKQQDQSNYSSQPKSKIKCAIPPTNKCQKTSEKPYQITNLIKVQTISLRSQASNRSFSQNYLYQQKANEIDSQNLQAQEIIFLRASIKSQRNSIRSIDKIPQFSTEKIIVLENNAGVFPYLPQKPSFNQKRASIHSIDSKQIKFTQMSDNFKSQGVPNIGNSCFLNSVIQFFYSAESLKEKLQKIQKKNNPKHRFINMISQIITSIDESTTLNNLRSRKIKNMEKLIEALSTDVNINYKKYSQEDSLNFLLSILDLISKEFYGIKLCFEIQYQVMCECKNGNDQMILIKDYCISIADKCEACQTKSKHIIQSSSEFLIYVNSSPNLSVKEIISYQTVDGFPINFSCISYIIYSGNGLSGHYKMHRLIQSQWYCFNDDYVSKVSFKQVNSQEKIVICLYRQMEDHDLN